jgi:ABC-type branched-subunit amino acid transport system permease subunit
MTASLGNLVSLGVLVSMPILSLILGEFWTGFFARCTAWMYLAASFSIAYSFAGIPTLAQSTLFGLGAYTTIWLVTAFGGNVLALLIAGTIAGAVAAFAMGAIVIRMSKTSASIATLIISVAAFMLANALVEMTGGADGLPLPPAEYRLLGFQVTPGPNIGMLLLGTTLLAAILAVQWLVTTTHAWTVVRAIQENEMRARVLGYEVDVYRLLVFGASGAVVGLGGALYALVSLHLTSDLLSLAMTFKGILWAIVGGVSTMFGGPIGVIVVQVATELLSQWTLRVDMIVGVFFIFIALVLPHGIMSLLGSIGRRAKPRETAVATDQERAGVAPSAIQHTAKQGG